MSAESQSQSQSNVVPEEFAKVLRDFVGDLKTTFPEYVSFINKWWKTSEQYSHIEDTEERKSAFEKGETKSIQTLFDYSKKKFPPRFFDILYKNEDIFKQDSDIDTEFLPQIHFKNLWQCDISDKTRETIWKYLQLIMFSIVGTIENKDAFGDTAKMFEAINEEEFKSKLEETLSQMQGLFDISGNMDQNMDDSTNGINMENMPNADDIHNHITGMLDGKLGQLAREIAEETAEDLNMDLEGITDMNSVFQNLIKNPTKLMGLVKSVGNKLDTKIKSGDIKESELISEATDMMNKMKNMPGMGNIQSMLNKMGMGNLGGGGGGGGKVNTAAMEANLNQKMKMAQTKERMRAKAEANNKAKMDEQNATSQQLKPAYSEEELLNIFNSGEKVERTPRGAKPLTSNTSNSTTTSNKKKKKK
jgi:hypothetical protein